MSKIERIIESAILKAEEEREDKEALTKLQSLKETANGITLRCEFLSRIVEENIIPVVMVKYLNLVRLYNVDNYRTASKTPFLFFDLPGCSRVRVSAEYRAGYDKSKVIITVISPRGYECHYPLPRELGQALKHARDYASEG
jgi:hypothetical protein